MVSARASRRICCQATRLSGAVHTRTTPSFTLAAICVPSGPKTGMPSRAGPLEGGGLPACGPVIHAHHPIAPWAHARGPIGAERGTREARRSLEEVGLLTGPYIVHPDRGVAAFQRRPHRNPLPVRAEHRV